MTVATTAPSSHTSIELAERHACLAASVGIQPNHVAEAAPDAWDEVARLAEHRQVVAIGETGLDRHWNDTPFPLQEDYFARHLELARRRRLAVIIHCREAEADVPRMPAPDYDRRSCVQMHSFTGDQATAEACLAMGLHISFAGMVQNAACRRGPRLPLALLVELIAYLAPVPVRKTQRAGICGSHGGVPGWGSRVICK